MLCAKGKYDFNLIMKRCKKNNFFMNSGQKLFFTGM